MGVYVNDNGTLRTIRRAFVNDNGTLREILRLSVNDNGTLRHIFMIQVQLTAAININRTAGTPATFTVASAGTYGPGASTTGDSGTWLVSGANSAYSVQFHPTSGSVSSGTVDSYLSLGSSQSWTRSAGAGSVQTVVGTLTIRRNSDSVVLATSTLTIVCDNT